MNPPTRKLHSVYRRTPPWAGTRWREGSKWGTGHVLHKGVTAGNGNPLGTLVSSRDKGEEKKKCRQQSERAHARECSFSTRASRGERRDLKVSRAAEKLARLISNGSFNNIPRRSSHVPPAFPLCNSASGYARIISVLYFGDAADSLRLDQTGRRKCFALFPSASLKRAPSPAL